MIFDIIHVMLSARVEPRTLMTKSAREYARPTGRISKLPATNLADRMDRMAESQTAKAPDIQHSTLSDQADGEADGGISTRLESIGDGGHFGARERIDLPEEFEFRRLDLAESPPFTASREGGGACGWPPCKMRSAECNRGSRLSRLSRRPDQAGGRRFAMVRQRSGSSGFVRTKKPGS